MRLTAVLTAAAAALVLGGCSSPQSEPPSAEQRFEAAVLSYPGFRPSTNPGANAKLIENGRSVCSVMDTPGTTELSMIRSLELVGYDKSSAAIITGMAVRHLCPGKTWPGVASTQVASAPTITTVAPVPAGPLTSFSDGIWEVGVDVAAGKYKTSGSTQCYWARLRTPDTSDIANNNYGSGPQTVQLKAGEYFHSQMCGTWTKV